MYKMNYDSPIGNIVLKSDGYSLVECYFSDEEENVEIHIFFLYIKFILLTSIY